MYIVQHILRQRVNEECFPHRSGYGDLWDDIQNLGEIDSSAHCTSLLSGKEAEESNANSEIERNEESRDWRNSEEEENGDKEDNTDDEDKEEEEGTICGRSCWLFCAVFISAVSWAF